VEQLVDPTSNFGVSQQHDDVQSAVGVPCAEHIINEIPADRTLTNDWDALNGNTAPGTGFLNKYSGCFSPANNSHT